MKMIIKISGTGCSNYKRLETSVEKVESIQDIMAYGVMSTSL